MKALFMVKNNSQRQAQYIQISTKRPERTGYTHRKARVSIPRAHGAFLPAGEFFPNDELKLAIEALTV